MLTSLEGIMQKIILEKSVTNQEWKEGYISSEDTQCFVTCDCGEELSVSDYMIVECPKCHNGYITEFLCYRIPAEALSLLTKRAADAPTVCAHAVVEPTIDGWVHCYVCGKSVRR